MGLPVDLIEKTDAYENELPVFPEGLILPKGEEISAWIDHTLLKPEATPAQITRLCQEAREHRFAAVCVNPVYVPLSVELLANSATAVCTVVGFPLGATLTSCKVSEAVECIHAGAREVDMVLSLGSLKGGYHQTVYEDIGAVVQAAHSFQAIVKVIIETALLSRREKILACLISQAAGADYVKTSTGFSSAGATVEDVELMRRVVGLTAGVKAAGGVRTFADALAMIRAGATRIGTSSGVQILQQAQV